MIVTCEQCQTRFKIPDEKVTDKGVKVRCTKCGHTFRVSRAAAPPAAPQPPPASDPFARFGVEVPPSPVSVPSSSPPRPPTERKPAAPFDFSSLVPPTSAAAAPASAAPFDFSALAPSTAPAAASAGAFDFSKLSGGTPAPALPPAPKTKPAPPAASTPAFDFSSAVGPAVPASTGPAFDFSEVGMPTGSPTVPDLPGFDFGAAPSQTSLPALDLSQPAKPTIPALDFPSEGGEDGLPRPSPGSAAAVRDALFDMSATRPAPETTAAVLDSLPEALAVPRPPTVRFEPESAAPAKRRRTALSVAVNIALAGAFAMVLLLVGNAILHDGTVDARTFSVARLKALVAPPNEYVASDISNGLYDTKAGRPVFYVVGTVLNRTTTSARAKVLVELIANETVVRKGETMASAPLTPEELFELTGADGVEQVLAKQAKRATALAKGERASFVMPFFEYPPDLKSFRVRVSVSAERQGSAAVGP